MYVEKFEMWEIIDKKAMRRSRKRGESTQKCF